MHEVHCPLAGLLLNEMRLTLSPIHVNVDWPLQGLPYKRQESNTGQQSFDYSQMSLIPIKFLATHWFT